MIFWSFSGGGNDFFCFFFAEKNYVPSFCFLVYTNVHRIDGVIFFICFIIFFSCAADKKFKIMYSFIYPFYLISKKDKVSPNFCISMFLGYSLVLLFSFFLSFLSLFRSSLPSPAKLWSFIYSYYCICSKLWIRCSIHRLLQLLSCFTFFIFLRGYGLFVKKIVICKFACVFSFEGTISKRKATRIFILRVLFCPFFV